MEVASFIGYDLAFYEMVPPELRAFPSCAIVMVMGSEYPPKLRLEYGKRFPRQYPLNLGAGSELVSLQKTEQDHSS